MGGFNLQTTPKLKKKDKSSSLLKNCDGSAFENFNIIKLTCRFI